MLTQQTLEKLHALRLTGMLDAFEQQLAQPETHELAFEERLALLLDREQLARDNRRLSRLLRAARLRIAAACVEDIDYRHARGLKRAQIAQLGGCQWLHQKHNLLLTGPTGTGKTYLACALGNQACRQGLSTRYFRLPRLLEQITIARGDGSYPRLMKQLAGTELLILDDLAIAPLTASQRNDFMESSRTVMVCDQRWSRVSCQSSTGTTISANRRSPMPSWTGCCTTPIGCP